MHYYQIIPLLKIGFGARAFTYASKKTIKPGSLVEISFGSRKAKGILLNKCPRPNFKVKEISKIIADELLDEKQLELAQKVSDNYFVSIGIALKFFIPPVTKKIVTGQIIKKQKRKFRLTTKQLQAVDLIFKKKQKRFLLFGPASSGKTEVAMELIEKTIAKEKQALVLIPEIFLSYQEIDRYQKRFGSSQTVFVHSGLKSSEYFSAWQKVRSGKAKVIIATKAGLFLPFKKLGFIIIDEEQDISHKQWDQSPRYHSRDVAFQLADIHQAKTVLMSSTPSLKTFHQTEKKEIELAELPLLSTKNFKPKKPLIQIVDLRKYFFKQAKAPLLTKELLQELELAMAKKQLSVLLVPYRGKSQAVFCLDCKKPITCPNCSTSLVYAANRYKCLHCSFKMPQLARCPHCKSFRLQNFGFGTEKIADEIKMSLPKARLEVADQTSFSKNIFRQELFNNISKGKTDILVGTQSVIKGFDFPRTGLAAVINASHWSGKSDFQFDEKWLGNLFQLAGRLNRPGSKEQGRLIIQTFKPDNPLLGYLEKYNWRNFVEAEMENRKNLNYPPYCRLAKLIFQDISADKVEKNTLSVYNQLLKIKSSAIIEIVPPYFGSLKKKRGRWLKNILIKARNFDEKNINKFLRNISKNWIIDIDPENIF